MEKSDMTEDREILLIATEMRTVFLGMLIRSIQTTNTSGSCVFACIFLKSMFDKFTNFNTSYRGGDGTGDGGYIDSKGNYHGHYWLDVSANNDSYIVDITADQFGDSPVVVSSLSKTNQYIAGDQQIVDQQFEELKKFMKCKIYQVS